MFSSNPFHYSDADIDNIDIANSAGQRFDGIEQEWDIITEVGLEATRRFAIDEDRELKVGLAGQYNWFRFNSIGSYAKIKGSVAYDLTPRDRVKLVLGHTPDRFKRNYRLPSGLFDEGTYKQSEGALEYERALTKRWSAGIGAELYAREYDPVFDFRDRDGDEFFLFSDYELPGDLRIGARLSFGEVDTGIENRGLRRIDRSFETLRFSPQIRKKLGEWDLRLRMDIRRKEYTTDELADDVRFDRVDARTTIRFEGRKPFDWYGGELMFMLGWAENDSDISDPTVTTEETGYDELMLGVGLQFTF